MANSDGNSSSPLRACGGSARTNRSARQSCSEIIVPILLEAGKRDADETLVKILEGRAPSADVLSVLADWAEKLDFEAEADRQAAAPAPLSVPEPVAPQRVEPAPITAAEGSRAAHSCGERRS